MQGFSNQPSEATGTDAGSPDGAEGTLASAETTAQGSGDRLRIALRNAADLAAASGVSVDDFMKMAWHASAQARPAAHARIARKQAAEEDRALLSRLADLRRQGKLAKA